MAGVTMRSAIVAAAMTAASLKKGKKRRRLLVRCRDGAGVGAAAGKADGRGSVKKNKKRRRFLVRRGDHAGAGAAGGKADGSGKAGGHNRDWWDLPETAVYLILKGLLPALADVFSFGSVCRAWRSVFITCKWELFSALSPFLVDRGSSSGAFGGFYNFPEKRFYRRKEPIAWPWTSNHRYMPNSKLEVAGVSYGYLIVCSSLSCADEGTVFLMDPMSPETTHIDLPPAPHEIRHALMTAPLTSPDCVIVAMDVDRTLYCRPGDTGWARHSFKEGSGHDEPDCRWMQFDAHLVAALGRKVYALSWNAKLVIMEMLFPRPRVTVVEATGLSPKQLSRVAWALLVESDGEILYIAEEGKLKAEEIGCMREHRYVVRRLDLPAREWVTLNTLGDRSLFLNRRVTSVTGTTARWGGGQDRIYNYCFSYDGLVEFHTKDGRPEHHPLPKEYEMFSWLVPSICYRQR